jgi:cyclase
MHHVPPAMLAALNAEGEIGELFRSFFGEFDFDGIELRPPDATFDGASSSTSAAARSS